MTVPGRITNMKIIISSLLIISLLIPLFVSAFSYEQDKPLAQYPEEGIFLGVAAGLARKFGGDPLYWRIGFVVASFTLLPFPLSAFTYLILAAIMPTRYTSESAPFIYFEQVNNIMKKMLVAGNDLKEVASRGEVSIVEYARKLRDITIEGRDKFNNLIVPLECKEIYQLFSEYFRYSILSADVLIGGLESEDEGKIREAAINAKIYDEKADELYSQAKSKILNWGR